MTKVLFVCHGNICRSAMAEFMFKYYVKEAGLEKSFYIESAGVSNEEEGSDMHDGAKAKLREKGIPFSSHSARKITPEDYKNFDFIIGMDVMNLYRMENLWNKDPDDKVKLLMTYVNRDKDIADPWYTGDFEATFRDLEMSLKALLEKLK